MCPFIESLSSLTWGSCPAVDVITMSQSVSAESVSDSTSTFLAPVQRLERKTPLAPVGTSGRLEARQGSGLCSGPSHHLAGQPRCPLTQRRPMSWTLSFITAGWELLRVVKVLDVPYGVYSSSQWAHPREPPEGQRSVSSAASCVSSDVHESKSCMSILTSGDKCTVKYSS